MDKPKISKKELLVFVAVIVCIAIVLVYWNEKKNQTPSVLTIAPKDLSTTVPDLAANRILSGQKIYYAEKYDERDVHEPDGRVEHFSIYRIVESDIDGTKKGLLLSGIEDSYDNNVSLLLMPKAKSILIVTANNVESFNLETKERKTIFTEEKPTLKSGQFACYPQILNAVSQMDGSRFVLSVATSDYLNCEQTPVFRIFNYVAGEYKETTTINGESGSYYPGSVSQAILSPNGLMFLVGNNSIEGERPNELYIYDIEKKSFISFSTSTEKSFQDFRNPVLPYGALIANPSDDKIAYAENIEYALNKGKGVFKIIDTKAPLKKIEISLPSGIVYIPLVWSGINDSVLVKKVIQTNKWVSGEEHDNLITNDTFLEYDEVNLESLSVKSISDEGKWLQDNQAFLKETKSEGKEISLYLNGLKITSASSVWYIGSIDWSH